MAKLAIAAGTQAIIATPHQLGAFHDNTGPVIRQLVSELRQRLADAHIPLAVMPGGDVRIEPRLIEAIRADRVLTLADRGKHVLLELPHELYFPLEPLLEQLDRAQLVGILSHPERNQGILQSPQLVPALVQRGCLMQVTAGSFLGAFGGASQRLSERLLADGLIHFVASDGHGTNSRRPTLESAYRCVAERTDQATADRLFRVNPSRVWQGEDVPCSASPLSRPRRSWFGWLARRPSASTVERQRV